MPVLTLFTVSSNSFNCLTRKLKFSGAYKDICTVRVYTNVSYS